MPRTKIAEEMSLKEMERRVPRVLVYTEIVGSLQYDLEGDLDDAIESLLRYKKDYEDIYKNLYIEYDPCHSDYDSDRLILKGGKLEDDKRYCKRAIKIINDRQDQKARKEAVQEAKKTEEYNQFLKLKKKFGE